MVVAKRKSIEECDVVDPQPDPRRRCVVQIVVQQEAHGWNGAGRVGVPGWRRGGALRR
jgi:hypothetical protein